MNIEKRIAEITGQGSELGLMSGPTGVLAHARIIEDGLLHYVFSFDDGSNWDHVLEFARMEDDGYYLNIYDQAGVLLGVIAPLEDEDPQRQWQAWQEYIKTPAGMAVMESIERAYQVHLNWNQ